MKILLILVVGLALAGAAVQATPPGPGETQGEMNHQASLDFEAADARLNKVYQELLPLLTSVEKEKLVAAQKKWIAFRDAEAEYQAAAMEGGTMATLLYLGTKAELTDLRTKSLSRDLEAHRAK